MINASVTENKLTNAGDNALISTNVSVAYACQIQPPFLFLGVNQAREFDGIHQRTRCNARLR